MSLSRHQVPLLKLVSAALLIGLMAATYFELPQKQALRPLRDWVTTPSTSEFDEHVALARDLAVPLKSSSEGYYINPHQLSSLVYDDSVSVLKRKSCSVLQVERQAGLLRIAEALSSTVEHTEHGDAVWRYPIRFAYGLAPGWLSAMAQARVAVVLKAASLCGPTEPTARRYGDLARGALGVFSRTVYQGGVVVPVGSRGGVWFEEYAQPGVQPPLVLNGHIYALLALRDLQSSDLAIPLDKLVDQGITALRERIEMYDRTFWSMYDQAGTLANGNYQALHARQMGQLADWLNDPEFARYERRFTFQRLIPLSPVFRLVMQPSRFLFGIVVLDVLVAFSVLILGWRILHRRRVRSLVRS